MTVGSLPAGDTRRSHRWRRAVISAVLLAVAFVALTARLFVWPSLPELPAHADAIVELSGPSNRDAATIELAGQGIAPLVIQSTTPGDAATGACLPPMPGVTIDCFSPVPGTTRGEARYIGQRAAEENWASVIIVTTPDHAWRARLRVARCFPGEIYVATSPFSVTDRIRQVPYQWAATVKAELLQRDC